MKTLALQKRLASNVLKVGRNRVWLDPERFNDIKEAITNEDIKVLIKEGVIKKNAVKGIKRRAGKIRQARRKKGRSRGDGKRKKKVKNKKRKYMLKIRKLRAHINILKKGKIITSKESNRMRKLAKAGVIRTKDDIIKNARKDTHFCDAKNL